MYRFNAPPGWRTPGHTSWRPSADWQPDPEWPPAPAGWRFWVGRRGRLSSGPIGAYGAVGAGRVEVACAPSSALLLHL